MALVALVAGAAGCGEPDPTTVRLRVFADPGLVFDALTLRAGDAPPQTLAALPELRVLVPDDWAGHATDFSLDGFSADALVASGTVSVVPVLHNEIPRCN